MDVTALGMIETIGLVTAIEAADAGLKAADVRLLGTDYVRGGLVMVRFEGDVAAVRAAVDAGEAAAKRVGKVFSAHVIARAMPEVFCMLASDVGYGPAKRAQDGCAQCGGCEGGRRDCGLNHAVPMAGDQPDAEANGDAQETVETQREHGDITDGLTREGATGEHGGSRPTVTPAEQREIQNKSLDIKGEHETQPQEHGNRAGVGKPPQAPVTAEVHTAIPSPAASPSLPPQDELAGWKVLALRTFARTLPGFALTPSAIRYANKQALLDALAAYRVGEV